MLNDRIEYVSIITNKICTRVRIDDIEMIEREGRRIHILTGQDEFICYEKIETLAPLLVNRAFFRAKSGLIVNFRLVNRLADQEIVFMSGRTCVIGRNNYIKTRAAYKRYLLGYPPFVDEFSCAQVAEKQDRILS